jgi:Flp pilus assembly protein TadD
MILLLAPGVQENKASVLGTFLLIFFASVTTQAQLSGSGIDEDRASGMRRGTNTIVGQVTFPPGRQAQRRCTVRLSSVVVGEFSTMTDDNGVFTFRRLREGSYFIRVEAGKEFLPAQETVDLFDNRGRTTTVQIQLKPKPSQAKVGVVNAALAGVPRPAVELYKKALASAANDRKKAVEQLEAALALHPEFVLALNDLSILYIDLGKPDKAAQALSQAVKIEPNNSTLRFNLGYFLMQMKNFVQADIELHRATELTSNYSLAHLYRGRVLVSLRKFEEAEKELQRVIKLAGNEVPMAYRYLGALYAEDGKYASAIDSLEKYLELAPGGKDSGDVQKIVKQLRDKLEKPKD